MTEIAIPMASAETEKETPDLVEEKARETTIVVQGGEYVPMQLEGGKMAPNCKQSHACCGCCCDTRRAVIVVNIISMSFAVLAILTISIVSSDKYAESIDDDQVLAALAEIDGSKLGVTIGFASAGIFCNACGIFGARRFNQWAIIVAGLWYVIEFVRSLVYLDLGGAIMSGFFAYPHVIFWQEMRKGIMAPATYPHEEQCCNCCK